MTMKLSKVAVFIVSVSFPTALTLIYQQNSLNIFDTPALCSWIPQQRNSSFQPNNNNKENGRHRSQNDVCQNIPLGTARSIWMNHLPELLEWSIHPYDKERLFVDFHAQILHLLSPDRLDRAIKTLPHRYWKSVEAVLNATRLRMESIKRNDDHPTRKTHILVMGGSVAEGDKCNPRVQFAELQPRRRACAWPFRLQYMLDRILGENVTEVTAATVGGTNSEAALMLLEYDLVPKEVDIVIHAYATNDMHAYTAQSATHNNVTLRDRIFDLTEQFVRKVFTRCRLSQQHPPLLLYLDDYIGNEQNGILDTAIIAQTIPFLANHYGFTALSYADSVRDMVYGDTQETFFSPFWKILNETTGLLFREVHPGLGAHVSISFILLYAFLKMTTELCDLPDFVHRRWGEARVEKGKLENGPVEYEPVGGLPELNNSFKLYRYYKSPKAPPKGLPPALYPNLTLNEVSQKWKDAPESFDCSNEYENRCIFAWVSRITNNCMIPAQLNETISNYTIENNGWESQLEFKKLGLVPSAGQGSRITLEFRNPPQPLSSIMISVMKSYGSKWERSRIRMEALIRKRRNQWVPLNLSINEFTGFHNKNTSEQYSYTSQFLSGSTTKDLRISIEQTTGNTSKIMGMAVCS